MKHQVVEVPGWPRPRGYANGVVGRGRVLWLAGQIAWNEKGEFTSDDLATQFGQALANVNAVLAAAGATPAHLVSMTVFVTDIEAYRRDAAAIGQHWRTQLGKVFPAMALVGVTALVEPRAKVEIQAIAQWEDA